MGGLQPPLAQWLRGPCPHNIQQLYDKTLLQWAAILQDTGDHDDSITLRQTAEDWDTFSIDW